MLISTRGRYALRILVDLAENQKGGYITLKESADRQEEDEIVYTDADLKAAYEKYHDPVTFDSLFDSDPDRYARFDTDTFNRAVKFRPNQLYCLLTYVKAAANFAGSSQKTRTEKDGTTVYIGENVSALEQAIGFAFNSPLLDSTYTGRSHRCHRICRGRRPVWKPIPSGRCTAS